MTVMNHPITISYRPMTEADLTAAYALSQIVKWPHRMEDWQLVEHLGVGFVAEHDGQTIGTALCWNHGDKFSSLGMVIVSPEFQGNGIGRQLMSKILHEIGDHKSALLFATPSGQPLYESFGFKAIGEVNQHQAIITALYPVPLATNESIRPMEPTDYTTAFAFAEQACDLNRRAPLTEILKSAQGVVLEQHGQLEGFALLREFGRGYAIGPVITKHQDQAKALILHCLNTHIKDFVRIDVPADTGLSPWLESVGLPQVDTVVQMSRGDAPQKDQNMMQFALINQALG
ncbi:GNAT family N-acetyltransferase [Marinomonas sp. THO17]|uniref:GNAT family N-acetyltransferase n=1 Tax=Marinomonas sp. THO17 TaxID=3149048 RepID=UPI00336C20BD